MDGRVIECLFSGLRCVDTGTRPQPSRRRRKGLLRLGTLVWVILWREGRDVLLERAMEADMTMVERGAGPVIC